MINGNGNIRSVGIFCGSAEGNRPEFLAAAAALGTRLASLQIRVVYGGGNVGLMGALADAALAVGGPVTGVITRKLRDVELAHPRVQPMIVTETMDERKMTIIRESDAFIAMPGGYGTYDELFEVLALCQLHIIHKPLGLLNTLGYFEPYRQMIANGIRYGFIRAEHDDFYVMDEHPEGLLEKLANHQPPSGKKWLEAFKHEKR